MKTVELREKRKRRREEIEVVLLISVFPCYVLLVFVCVCVRVQGLDNKPIIASLPPSLHKQGDLNLCETREKASYILLYQHGYSS